MDDKPASRDGEHAAGDGSAPAAKPNFIRRAILGSGFEVIGYGSAQVLRLASNLILTRILAPDAFGLSALIMLVTFGLHMFSDFGFLPAIVQHEKGGEARFLNTAWTLQIVRGLVIGVVVALLAKPMALLYGEPALTSLMLVSAFGSVAYGMTSTALYTLRRAVRTGPVVLMEIAVQATTLLVTSSLALLMRSVWALVIGLVISNFLHAAFSYFLPAQHKHEICWDKEALHGILTFGKWVFLSSAVFFLSRQGDRLLLGKLLGVRELGIYSVAVMLSDATNELVTRITHGVIFPLLSRVKEEGRDQLARVFTRTQLIIDCISLPALGGLAALGTWVIKLLYDDRYIEAGWMLQALSIRVATACVFVQYETCLTALGKPGYAFGQNLLRAIWVAIAVPIGFHFYGLRGVVWAMALSELPLFVVLAPPLWRERLLKMTTVLFSVALFAAGYAVGKGVDLLLHRIFS